MLKTEKSTLSLPLPYRKHKEDLKLATGPYCRQYESTAFFSSLVAHLPGQDVSSGAKTHLGAAQTHYGFVMHILVL